MSLGQLGKKMTNQAGRRNSFCQRPAETLPYVMQYVDEFTLYIKWNCTALCKLLPKKFPFPLSIIMHDIEQKMKMTTAAANELQTKHV